MESGDPGRPPPQRVFTHERPLHILCNPTARATDIRWRGNCGHHRDIHDNARGARYA
jgi:hypothetical protein